MMTFVLMVARQLSEGATDQQEEQLQEMGGTLRAGVKRLFRSLFRQKGRGGQGEGQRKVESEVLEWVASRLGPEQLGRLMFRQQCRAYSRAAGFRAICELLQAAEGWESLQARLLRTLRDVLRPPPGGASRRCATRRAPAPTRRGASASPSPRCSRSWTRSISTDAPARRRAAPPPRRCRRRRCWRSRA